MTVEMFVNSGEYGKLETDERKTVREALKIIRSARRGETFKAVTGALRNTCGAFGLVAKTLVLGGL